MLNFRQIHPTDAEAFLALLKEVETDSPYVVYEAGERTTTVEEQMKDIEENLRFENTQMWVVEDRDIMVGWLGAMGEKRRRIKHSATIGIVVKKEYRGQGIGKKLFTLLHTWAPTAGIKRLELIVHVNNIPGVKLYEKMGYKIEGIKKSSYLLDGEWTDEYMMARVQ